MELLKRFIKEEEGMEAIQVAIILAIGVGLAIALRGVIGNIWDTSKEKIDKVEDALKDF